MSIQWITERYEEIHSTQDALKDLAAKGAREGQIVIADMQTGGRGRHGREWISLAGNLYFSLLLRPDVNLQNVGQLGLVVGLALGRALVEMVDRPEDISLKWPNDILYGGEKCSGILIETDLNTQNQLDYVAVGIGINTKAAPEMAAVLDINNEMTMERVLHYIDQVYSSWCVGDFKDILKEWHEMAHPAGTQMSVKLGGETIAGAFDHVDEAGHLHVRLGDNTLRVVTAGDVYVTGD